MVDLFLKKLNKISSNKQAIIFNSKILTYGDLLIKINECYNIISDAFDHKKVVVILGDYSFNSIAILFALCRHKCIFIPIISENEEEIAKKIEVSNPDYIINTGSIQIKSVKRNDSFHNSYYKDLFSSNKSGLVLFSSGSTGNPKAMVHDFDNLISTYNVNKIKNLNFLVFLLFDHIGGLNTMLNILSMGSTMIIPEKREPESIAKLIQKFKVNILPSSPTFLNLMNIGGIFESHDLSSLKLITYGTEPMSENLLSTLKNKLPKTRLIQTFGTSETGIIKTKSKSSGSLLVKFEDNNQEIKIVDGELWIKSKTRVLGYINHNNNSFTNDGWFKTGDLVEEREDGYLKIIGRISKVINVGGEKVFPAEVEAVILNLNFALDCTVYAKESLITGQVVAAKVVVKSLREDIKQIKKNIKLHCKKNLERYKVPVEIIITDKINYTSRFKKKLE
ncbi:fatty acid--CoA ligase family protein [Flavobacteriaceae bacterium]|nr:fatty acid--CoA ligase family protein [Flavobacteriaceae bacterium]